MQRPEDGSDVTGFGSFDNSTCKRVLDLLEPGDLRLGQVVIKGAAEEAATRKTAKYLNIQAHHIFQPVDFESLGPISVSGCVFLSKLVRKLADQSGDDREISFLFQRLTVQIQQYNAILLHDCFVKEEEE